MSKKWYELEGGSGGGRGVYLLEDREMMMMMNLKYDFH